MKITIGPKEDLNGIVDDFLKDYGIGKIIAFSGGADSELSNVPGNDPLQIDYKKFSDKKEKRIIGDAIEMFNSMRIAILTGGSKWGVPKTAATLAKKHGLTTIGVYPLCGKKHALSDDFLDLSICVEPMFKESRWGDESSIFAKLLNGVIVYSGGSGTLIEISHILKMNEAILKYQDVPLKIIVPLSGTGGVAGGLPFIWAKQHVKKACFPDKEISKGNEAADFLIKKLDLYDYLLV